MSTPRSGHPRALSGALFGACALFAAAPAPARAEVNEVRIGLTDGSIVYSVAPTGLMKLAAFMVKTGELKTAPASWQDVFFPLIASLKGS